EADFARVAELAGQGYTSGQLLNEPGAEDEEGPATGWHDPASGGNPGPGLSDAAVDAELEADAAEQRAAFAWTPHQVVPLPGSVRDRLDRHVPDEWYEPLRSYPLHAMCSGCGQLIRYGEKSGWAHVRSSAFASLDENRST